jgi:hypothetical protein
MKHYILVSITIPDRRAVVKWQAWRGLQEALESQAEQAEGIEKLSDNVWLIPRDSGVSFLGFLVHQADEDELRYRVRFLMEDDSAMPGAKPEASPPSSH